MRYRKLRQIILIMCCFYFIRSKVKKNGCVKKKLQEQGVQDVVNINNVFTCKKYLFLSSQVSNVLQIVKRLSKCQ